MVDQYKVVCDLSNGANPKFMVTTFFDAGYLTNATRYIVSMEY